MANMAANPCPSNPFTTLAFPGQNGLIGPGRSAERPAGSSSRAMETLPGSGDPITRTPELLRRLWVLAMAFAARTTSCPLLSGNPIHYSSNLSTSTHQNPHARWEELSRGFPVPSVGSGESSLARTLGERKKRKLEASTTNTNFDPLPGQSHFSYGMGNNRAPPYAGPSHFDYREPSGSQLGAGSMNTRYFDEGQIPQCGRSSRNEQSKSGPRKIR